MTVVVVVKVTGTVTVEAGAVTVVKIVVGCAPFDAEVMKLEVMVDAGTVCVVVVVLNTVVVMTLGEPGLYGAGLLPPPMPHG